MLSCTHCSHNITPLYHAKTSNHIRRSPRTRAGINSLPLEERPLVTSTARLAAHCAVLKQTKCTSRAPKKKGPRREEAANETRELWQIRVPCVSRIISETTVTTARQIQEEDETARGTRDETEKGTTRRESPMTTDPATDRVGRTK